MFSDLQTGTVHLEAEERRISNDDNVARISFELTSAELHISYQYQVHNKTQHDLFLMVNTVVSYSLDINDYKCPAGLIIHTHN